MMFRKINGRIIPFRDTKITVTARQQKDGAKGAGLIAAGVGTTLAAGKLYRVTVKKSVGLGAKGFMALERASEMRTAHMDTLFKRAARMKGTEKMTAVAEAMLKRGATLGKFATGVRIGGIALGSVLIGAGVAKVHQAARKKQVAGESKAIGSAIAAGSFVTGAYGAAGARQALKGTYKKAYPIIRAFKGRLKL